MEVVPDCSGLNWRVISNRQPPMKLAPVREAPGKRPGNGSRQAPVPGRDTLSASEKGCRGMECCPFFLQHLPPPVGACGERNYGLFFATSESVTDS